MFFFFFGGGAKGHGEVPLDNSYVQHISAQDIVEFLNPKRPAEKQSARSGQDAKTENVSYKVFFLGKTTKNNLYASMKSDLLLIRAEESCFNM